MLIGNLLGSLFVAYFLAVKSGVETAELPLARAGGDRARRRRRHGDRLADLPARRWAATGSSAWRSGWRWRAEDIAGKILAIFFPIMAFVAMGFDHVVANMFFMPGGDLRDAPGID